MSETKILLNSSPWTGEIELLIKQGKAYATNITFENLPRGGLIKPTLSLEQNEAQGIFNQLWHMGFRPKDGTGNSGHIESMKYHLEDMRKLVFKDLTNNKDE